jgi:hypothetical protein
MISTLKNLGFEAEKGQLREWMTVAREKSAWGRKVEYKLLLPPSSFTNLRRHCERNTNDFSGYPEETFGYSKLTFASSSY